MNKIIDVLSARLGWDEEKKQQMALILKAEPEGDEEKQSYLKAIEAISPQLESLGTKDYFVNNPDTIKALKGKLTADFYDGVETKSQEILLQTFSDLIGEDDLKKIFSNKSIFFADKFGQAASLIKDGFTLKEKTLKSEKPEAYQNALKEKDSVINQLRAQIDETKGQYEKDLAARERDYQLELIKGDLKGKLGKLPLADAEKQLDLAFMYLWNDLNSQFHLKRDGKGNISPFQKENPDLPANDETTKTALNLDTYIVSQLSNAGLLRRNNGGGQHENNGAGRLPDGNDKPALPEGMDPKSFAAQRYLADMKMGG